MSRPSRYAGCGKRDANHKALVDVYLAHGWKVQDTSSVGGDCADAFLCDPHGAIHAREFKTLKGVVKPEQQRWLDTWGGKVIRTEADALADIRETQ